MTATEAPKCAHSGRVRPVVWKVTPEGDKVPVTVVCGQCWRPISASAPAHTTYDEAQDGWYHPVEQ